MDLKMDPQRPEYHRAVVRWARRADGGKLDGEFVAESTGGQISSRILSLRSANVLLEIPKAKGILPSGTLVSALIIGNLSNRMPEVEDHAILQIRAP